MKKLMFALAVAMIAGVTQAASMIWGTSQSTTYGLVDGEGNLLTSAPDYSLVLVNVTGLTQDKWASDGTVVSTASFVYSATKGGQKVQGTLSATVTADGTATDKAYWNSQVYAVMVKDKDNNISFLKKGEDDVVQTFSPNFTDNTTAMSSLLPSAKYTAVPEPTSGLLLVMGLSALALRRRKQA